MNRETALYVEHMDPSFEGTSRTFFSGHATGTIHAHVSLPEMERAYPYAEGWRVVSHSISMYHGVSPEGSSSFYLSVLLERIKR